MDRFQEMSIFTTVVDEGGFSAAARRLNISPASVTRAVAALEKRVGVHLLLRNTRRMSLSGVGEYFLKDCRHVLGQLKAAEAALDGTYETSPCGTLTLTAPVLFAEQHLVPLLGRYMTRHKQVNIAGLFQDRDLNLLEHGVDVAIRIGSHLDPNEHAVKIGVARQVLCASPGYLETHGVPQHPRQLLEAVTIHFSSSPLAQEWPFRAQQKLYVQNINPRVSVNSLESAIDLARQGIGITRAPLYRLVDDVKQGRLNLLLEAYEPAPVPIYIVTRKSNSTSIKIRTFVDFLVDHLCLDNHDACAPVKANHRLI